jgi:hypothetical protein
MEWEKKAGMEGEKWVERRGLAYITLYLATSNLYSGTFHAIFPGP